MQGLDEEELVNSYRKTFSSMRHTIYLELIVTAAKLFLKLGEN